MQMVLEDEDDNVYHSLPKQKKTKRKQTKQTFCQKTLKVVFLLIYIQDYYMLNEISSYYVLPEH